MTKSQTAPPTVFLLVIDRVAVVVIRKVQLGAVIEGTVVLRKPLLMPGVAPGIFNVQFAIKMVIPPGPVPVNPLANEEILK